MLSQTESVVLIQFVLVTIVSCGLMKWFALRGTSMDVMITVTCSWIFGMAGILLLPYDISIVLSNDVNPKHVNYLSRTWETIYWITFVLAWLALPIQLEFHRSGEFTFLNKVYDAVYKNVLMYVFGGIVVVIFVIYETIRQRSSDVAMTDFLMAVGNTYGIFLLVALAGSGLIMLPRRLWELTKYEAELQRAWIQAPTVEEAYQEARFGLEEWESKSMALCEHIARSVATGHALDDFGDPADLQLCSVILRGAVEGYEAEDKIARRRKREGELEGASCDVGESSGLSLKRRLVEAHTQLKLAQIIFLAAQRQWRALLRRAEYLESVLAERDLSDNDSNPLSLTQIALRGLSIASLLLSILILWCEVLVSLNGILPSPLGLMIDANKNGNSTLGVQVICFGVLSYLALCTFYSLFNVNIAGVAYSLSPQSSPPSSLLANGIYFSRLQFSIGFNFVILCGSGRLEHMCFNELMQNMSTVPIAGTSINTYLPVLMLMVFLLALFRQYERFISVIPGFEAEGIQATNNRGCWFCVDDPHGGGEDGHHPSRSLTSEQVEVVEAGRRLVEAGKSQLARARVNSESAGKTAGDGAGAVGGGGVRNSISGRVAASFGVVESPMVKISALPAEFLSNLKSQMKTEPRSHRYGHLDIDTPEGIYEDEQAAGEDKQSNEEAMSLPPDSRGGFNIDMGAGVFGRGRYSD